MRTLIAGGGTGGHLTPALAVAQALRRADPSGEVLLVGRRGGVAERLVTGVGMRLETLDVSGFDLSSPARALHTLLRLPAALVRSLVILRRFRPDVVVGAAGYVCVPVVLAARLLRRPVVLLEQNAVPGRAVRLLSGTARAVATTFPETVSRLPRARVVETGNPVREEVARLAPAPLGDRCRRLLVMGGSQGARRLNTAMAACAAQLLAEHEDLVITNQCGTLDAAWSLSAADRLPPELRRRYHVVPFIEDAGAAIRDADLVVMRAGGSSLAECTLLGRPMILVPYPHAGGHQAHNAAPLVAARAAVLVPDEECDGPRLRREVSELVRQPERWRSMAAASAAMARPDAARRVVELVREAAGAR